MHKIFISHHHENDWYYKDELLRINSQHEIFIDMSVDTGDIDENLPDQTIRELIRDNYLRNSTVTILLVGTETTRRKHIDWEIYSSMYDGTVNKKSGILVINLPSIYCSYYNASHSEEKERVYPETTNWTTIDSRSEYESRYPYMPARIIDNLLKNEVRISVVPWEKIANNPSILSYLIEATHADKGVYEYDLTRQMRRADS